MMTLARVLVACASALARPSLARADGVGLDPAAPVAPAGVVVTASVAPADPIVAYDWGPSAEAPRCRASSCRLAVNVASCQRLEVAATTDLGETVTATGALCALDGAARPPEVELVLTEEDGAIGVTPRVREGAATVVLTRLWVDAAEPLEPARRVSIERDGGCHAVDLLAVDAEGRVGLDRRSVCTAPDAPRLWLGGTGGAFPVLGSTLAVCAEAIHPLGLPLEVVGDGLLDGCGPAEDAPRRLVRRVEVVRDPSGAVSTASLLVAGSTGRPTLLFAHLPPAITGSEGVELRIPLSIYGGVPPFDVEAVLVTSDGLRYPLPGQHLEAATRVFAIARPSPVRGARIVVTVRDGRGLEDETSASLDVVASDHPSAATSAKAACSDAGADPRAKEPGAPLGAWMPVVLLALWGLRLRTSRRGGDA